jgi:hypothetical protein
MEKEWHILLFIDQVYSLSISMDSLNVCWHLHSVYPQHYSQFMETIWVLKIAKQVSQSSIKVPRSCGYKETRQPGTTLGPTCFSEIGVYFACNYLLDNFVPIGLVLAAHDLDHG